jgi:hypothetical protein
MSNEKTPPPTRMASLGLRFFRSAIAARAAATMSRASGDPSQPDRPSDRCPLGAIRLSHDHPRLLRVFDFPGPCHRPLRPVILRGRRSNHAATEAQHSLSEGVV